MVFLPSGLFSCFKPRLQTDTSQNGLTKRFRQDSCVFCDVSIEKGFQIAYEDEHYVAFQDRRPASRHHFLVIPKEHVESVRSLRGPDVEMVKDMENIGNTVLSKLDVPITMRKMGFHIPPFNSVDHLHLHVQGLPYLSSRRAAKYPISMGNRDYSKGLSWFAEVSQVVCILQQGKRVGVMPC
ncbi:unnamed protein product [Cyclocybe aegerita]|uniref:HIT domain-containing protein n=1 Tax=Cyclocybe aegerita TaxID=1973307 RepID=A0A8S0WF01_CYCAE|nr:unnamed protein product [Cyclocybe aegerita]